MRSATTDNMIWLSELSQYYVNGLRITLGLLRPFADLFLLRLTVPNDNPSNLLGYERHPRYFDITLLLRVPPPPPPPTVLSKTFNTYIT